MMVFSKLFMFNYFFRYNKNCKAFFIYSFFVSFACIWGCQKEGLEVNPSNKNDNDQERVMERNTMEELEGLWASCPEPSEIGPVFSQLHISIEGDFEFDIFALDTGEGVWKGENFLKGHIDLHHQKLVPSNEHDNEAEELMYEITKEGDLLIKASTDEGVEEKILSKIL